jgi:hypothetical protein
MSRKSKRLVLQGYHNQLKGLLNADRTGSEIVVHKATVEALVKILEQHILELALPTARGDGLAGMFVKR